jgi:hypothetical protein
MPFEECHPVTAVFVTTCRAFELQEELKVKKKTQTGF